ncbi:TadE/TadG family type IV pilus assembly protein [Streptomyces sp. CAU 1734]|uniref:TadE/TadG family type IV pilus assembly protein n=1 Tax=Streptomyces sp. CAU 1734 TaxID=3140360 RepID=UPI003260BC78
MTCRADRGQAAVEFAGLITLLLIAGLAAIQLGLVAYTAQQAGTAARAAARTASQEDGAEYAGAAGRAAMSEWLDGGVEVGGCGGGGEVTAVARISVPSVIPLFSFDAATRTVTMPCDH